MIKFKILLSCFPRRNDNSIRVGDTIYVNHLYKLHLEVRPKDILDGFVEDGFLEPDARSGIIYHLTDKGYKELMS